MPTQQLPATHKLAVERLRLEHRDVAGELHEPIAVLEVLRATRIQRTAPLLG